MNPYDGIEMPKPPKGYRLAEWGEAANESKWWVPTVKHWNWWGRLTVSGFNTADPLWSVFAIPEPRVSIPLVPVTDSFEGFKASVEAKYGHPHLRNGQIAYNELNCVRDDIAGWVRGVSNLDPFYNDSNLSTFWECVKERWDQ